MLREVSIEIIRKCPNQCIYCSSLSDDTCSEMIEYSKFVSIAEAAMELGVNTICLSGGEPFMHPEIINMIKAANSLGLYSFIYTSGIMADELKTLKPLDVDMLKSIAGPATKLIFNVEAASQATYDLIMGTNGCFEFMKPSI